MYIYGLKAIHTSDKCENMCSKFIAFFCLFLIDLGRNFHPKSSGKCVCVCVCSVGKNHPYVIVSQENGSSS